MGRIPYYTDDELMSVMEQSVRFRWGHSSLAEDAIRFIQFKQTEGFPFAPLTFLHFRMWSEETSEDLIEVCAAVELLLLALDIQDDVEDRDAPWKPWMEVGEARAMNASTALLMLAFDIIHGTSFQAEDKERAGHYLRSCVMNATQGQHDDLQQDFSDEAEILEMVARKSASLMNGACLVGMALAGVDVKEDVESYSRAFGVAAQLANDLHDVQRLDFYNDLVYKKYTLPIYHLMQEDTREADIVRSYYNGSMKKESFLDHKEQVYNWIQTSPSIMYVKVLKRNYLLQALERLSALEANETVKGEMWTRIEQL
ncbi:hypothetical protein N781_05190 [Pontibacillus halophilus JSM 076056 = DSM 19796]|uniref:Isoprenyl transferase n=1 Tax=Pontibacillus halophilus JSM 076056 = DSM 19796 TaxID=1385510 RepID=A0A0A5GD76_9BACI|nr:polyprenyl synthetase family protein [Pontibacillus halophilus]KGX91171.1 hypothetical protein N781_05190 [Pontibacillus halophilus JSM 076056 = DSM 19796]